MMYLPKHFSVKEECAAFDLINQYPFATLISYVEADPFVSHLPLLLDRTRRTLIGHMARANGHWRMLQEKAEVTILFHGPHTYITPTWYVSGRDVPTWNYAVVHVVGRAKLIEDFDGLTALLQRMTDKFEAKSENPWRFELPDDLVDPSVLTKAIIGFEIPVDELQGKFKLSQNRSQADQEGVRQGLGNRDDDQSKAVLGMMSKG